MSNILFVLYHHFQANSAVHVHHFANQLIHLGHNVLVTVPKNKETGSALGEALYTAKNFDELEGLPAKLFKDKRGPDIVHAWTPREGVRRFCDTLRESSRFQLLVHLEDNEEAIYEANLCLPFPNGVTSSNGDLPLGLSHPGKYQQFLSEAAGITIIMDRLEKFVPPQTPQLTLWPGADPRLFYPRAKDEQLLKQFRIPINSTILCYTGNVHAANAHEVRSLYLAVAMLNREGMATTLVRAGRDYYPFLGPEEQWAKKHSVELGYVKHLDIGRVLSLADILVQPGTDNLFNEYRLPSKLPEFFAMGRPVVLPQTNVGRFVKHGEDAWVLPKVDALRITEAVRLLRTNGDLAEKLS
ncbi:MAG: glycosyltransferase, partial [Verrucomicrobiota bacterium]